MRAILDWLINLTIGRCSHPRTSFPQSPRGGRMADATVSCLSCGKRLGYDWGRMEVVK